MFKAVNGLTKTSSPTAFSASSPLLGKYSPLVTLKLTQTGTIAAITHLQNSVKPSPETHFTSAHSPERFRISMLRNLSLFPASATRKCFRRSEQKGQPECAARRKGAMGYPRKGAPPRAKEWISKFRQRSQRSISGGMGRGALPTSRKEYVECQASVLSVRVGVKL